MDIHFDEVKQHIDTAGSIGIMSVDTVYGVVARAEDPAAVRRLYVLKERERKPGTVIAATVEQFVNLGMKRRYLTAVEHFWPGAVSVVIPCGVNLVYLHQGVQSIAVRIPANEAIRTLLMHTGPLLTSSANQPGMPPATTIDEAKAYFGAAVDFYVDGGNLADRVPSTIIRIVDDAVEIIRQGAVIIDEETGALA